MFQALQVLVQQVLGQLAWDLPAQKAYTPSTQLPFTLKVTNPTTGQRTYKVQVQAIAGGQVVWYADLVLEGQADAWFPVPAGGSLTIQAVFSADQSNFTLTALLVDQVTNTTVASVQIELVGPTPTPTTPTPTPRFDLTPVVGILTVGMVMQLVVKLPKMFQKKR